jgi:DNA polymerase III subunit delta
MAELKPAYLVAGDDDVRIDTWRARVRDRATREAGAGALERFDARETGPGEVAAAASLMTLGAERRYLLVEDAGAWKPGDLEPLEQALAAMAPDTVLVLVVRGKPAARLRKAVEAAGGEVREYSAPKPWKLPEWVREQAREHGLELDKEAAKALVATVGQRLPRLVRELEKLACAAHPRVRLSAEDVEEFASAEASAGVYDLADALVEGGRAGTVALAEEILASEGRAAALLYPLGQRVREVHRARELLDAGAPEAKVTAALPLPPWRAKRVVAQAQRVDPEALEAKVCALADLELRTRSGEGLDEGTELSLALARATREGV